MRGLTAELAGWLLFLLSAVAFLAVAARDGDLLLLAGSLLFLGGVVAFLVPLVQRLREQR